MAVSVKTRVLLWGRAGGRCSFDGCNQELIEDATVADDESLVGDIAHVVAESPEGPRGESHLTPEERDKYANLILLCKRHHKVVDDQENTYTVEVLQAMKAAHEARVRAALSTADLQEQRDREIYAAYVEYWQEVAQVDRWQAWTSWLMQAQPSLSADAPDRFQALREWILSRIWPKRYPELEAAFENFSIVLGDLVDVILRHVDHDEGRTRLWMRKFYRDAYGLENEMTSAEREQESARLLAKYEYQTDLIADLTLELTRAANYICDWVRHYVDPVFRIEEGALLLPAGMDISLRTRTFRPEYVGDERTLMPYPGLKRFETEARATRDFHYGPRDNNPFRADFELGDVE
jgi:hypothetical protein